MNPLNSQGDGVYIITFPYFGAGAPAQGELKELYLIFFEIYIKKFLKFKATIIS